MIIPLLAKLDGIILEKKINELLEMEGKRAKGQACFRRHHSTMYHLVTLRIIAEECRTRCTIISYITQETKDFLKFL